MEQAIRFTNFPGLPIFRRGKVRDVYDLGETLLIVATDRISAFDVIMEDPIPGKGRILTELSLFWFELTKHIIPNHVISSNPADYPEICKPFANQLEGRSMLVKKTSPLPIECVIRGYLAGSGWKEYTSTGIVCGIELPDGLHQSEQLNSPIFTPATKAEEGHDENEVVLPTAEDDDDDVDEQANDDDDGDDSAENDVIVICRSSSCSHQQRPCFISTYL